MSISLKPEHLKHYKDFALLLFKYGRRDLVQRAGLSELLPREPQHDRTAAAAAEEFAADIERLGPTFIKLGQLLSTRPDIVPPAYAEALARLQDDCDPLPFSDIEGVLTQELGVAPATAFRFIDAAPLATASMSQVHRAVLRDGREIVLKVQRPGLREQVLSDLEALGQIAAFLYEHTDAGQRFAVDQLFEEFRKSLLRELDFRQETMHLLTISANLREIPEIVIPQPVLGYTTSRVLAMELIAGTKITELSRLANSDSTAIASPMRSSAPISSRSCAMGCSMPTLIRATCSWSAGASRSSIWAWWRASAPDCRTDCCSSFSR